MFRSRWGAMIFSSGASAFTARSKRTWSLPLPVAPWATAVAPCFWATVHQVPRDQRTGERGGQRIDALVERVRLQRGEAEVLRELFLRVHHLDRDRAGVLRALGEGLRVASLAHVGVAADHVVAVVHRQDADQHRGIQASGVREDDLLLDS